MSQEQIIDTIKKHEKELLRELQNLEDSNKRLDKIWNKALSTEDLSLILGLSIVATSRSIRKLILSDEMQELRNNIDRRKIKYTTKRITLQ